MHGNDRIAVWVIEDNRALREALAGLLDDQPDLYCAHALPDCERMLEVLDAGEAPDVVLMDIGLPGLSGIEGIRRLHGLSPTTRVLVLTIHEDDQQVFDAISAGASGYLLKPLPPQQLLEAIGEVMRGAAPINPFIAGKLLAQFARKAQRSPPVHTYGLSQRERGILELLVEGLPLKRIAERLGLSYHTICNHLRNVYSKLHVRSRSSAVAKALRESLL